jgi:pyruvate kinase
MLNLPEIKTKIVCTIGPASSDEETIKKMIQNGMNIARINFSHGSFESHQKVINLLRQTAKSLNKRIVILGDLSGPKIRIGDIQPLDIKVGDRLILSDKPQEGVISVNLKDFSKYLKVGDVIYVNDGFLQFKVEDKKDDKVYVVSLTNGKLTSRKGINLPNVDLPLKAIGEFEKKCIEFSKEVEIDALCVSFVRDRQDIVDAREYAKSIDYYPFLIAKIERPKAVENIDEIIQEADGIMVARGDLGIETPIECIAITQKRIIKKANLAGKPVTTATQMLESMIESVRPTRAEATDVANAILDGTDCLMLSAETAVGKYPDIAVLTLKNIAKCIEKERYESPMYEVLLKDLSKSNSLQDTMTLNAFNLVKNLNPEFVITPTSSGATARRMSRFKLPVWIIAVCFNKNVEKSLEFSYGVYPVYEEQMPKNWKEYIKNITLLKNGYFVLIKGPSEKNPDESNTLEVIRV